MVVPAQILDLRPWKITLPIGPAEKPTEIKWPTLGTYQHSEYFCVEPSGGVRFRAPVNGTTTSGSKYPRCELREMNADGSNASWSSSSGCHVLTVVEAFTDFPHDKPHVVGAQIHDASDDVSVFRLEGAKLYVTRGDDTHYALADAGYVLGTPFEAKFVVWRDQVKAYYNGRLVTTISGAFSGAYFKAGCYTQANATNSKPADSSNYGEVRVHSVKVEHLSAPPGEPAPTAAPIVIIRHGEKDDNADGKEDVLHRLSERGQRRAGALPDLFVSGRVPRPTWIFASKGNTDSMRMLQTAQPTAERLGLTVDTRYDSENAITASAKLLVERARAGKTVLAVLEHSAIPGVAAEVAKLLGAPKPPTTWSGEVFDLGWMFAGGGFSVFDEAVLPGDRSYQEPTPPAEEDDVTDADRQMLTEVRDLLRWMWSQLAGQDAAPFAFTGWPSFEGGSGKALTLVDYGRQADVQLEDIRERLAAIEAKLA